MSLFGAVQTIDEVIRVAIDRDEATEVEWHDARVREVRALADGRILIDFIHVVLLQTEADRIVETWSYRATLMPAGVERISVTGVWEEDEFVSDGNLKLGSTEHCLLQPLRSGIPATLFQLEFSARGARMEIVCANAQLNGLVPVKRIK